MKDLSGKVVLVTGAASGIGRAAATAFAREGAGQLVICDVNGDGLAEATAEIEAIGRRALAFTTDVSNFEEVDSMVEQVTGKAGRIDVLVNVAGIGIMAPIEALDIKDWRDVIGVNLFGTINTIHKVYPYMVERGSGHIVNVASTDGLFVPGAYGLPYSTSKFGVVGLTEGLMLEASLHNIGVTCVCPSIVRTPMFDTIPIKGFRPEVRKLATRLLTPFAAAPREVAEKIVEAVKNEEFLVLTTIWARAAYYRRRHNPSAWFRGRRRSTRRAAKMLDKYRITGG